MYRIALIHSCIESSRRTGNSCLEWYEGESDSEQVGSSPAKHRPRQPSQTLPRKAKSLMANPPGSTCFLLYNTTNNLTAPRQQWLAISAGQLKYYLRDLFFFLNFFFLSSVALSPHSGTILYLFFHSLHCGAESDILDFYCPSSYYFFFPRPVIFSASTPKKSFEMAPKKKGNKNAQEDWEAELGESIAPVAADAAPANGENGEEDESAGGGGLMAIMRKNKERRKKKGIVDEEPAPEPAVVEDLSAKAPVEASLDDDEFALPQKKGKGGKGKPAPAAAKNDDKDDLEESGRILTKAEKEKLKKEREKQRKKEQVCISSTPFLPQRH